MESDFIPDRLYKRIKRILPIACVDLLIETDNGLLLGVRKRPPGIGAEWPIGGRILFGESPENAVKRKAKEEAGIDVKIVRNVGTYSTFFTKKSGEERHTVNIVYVARMTGGRLRPMRNTEVRFARKPSRGLPAYTAAIIRDSGVFGNVREKPANRNDHFVF